MDRGGGACAGPGSATGRRLAVAFRRVAVDADWWYTIKFVIAIRNVLVAAYVVLTTIL